MTDAAARRGGGGWRSGRPPKDCRRGSRLRKLPGYHPTPPSQPLYEKLCYYIIGVKRQAVAQPLKNGVPVEKICERLKKTSAEICALREGAGVGAPAPETIDDYSKLRVNQLKSIMAEKGIKCPDCLEKADFVRKLESVVGKATGKAPGKEGL